MEAIFVANAVEVRMQFQQFSLSLFTGNLALHFINTFQAFFNTGCLLLRFLDCDGFNNLVHIRILCGPSFQIFFALRQFHLFTSSLFELSA